MFFLSPLALLGLAAALVPPLLHLFQRRTPPELPFPAVRYLRQTEREAQRQIRLRHLLLMLLRVLGVVLIVLAAARPVVPGGGAGLHEPTAVVVVLDNSLSSGAVLAGTRVADDLAARARETFRAAQSGDALWLVTADGIARRGTAEELLALASAVRPEPRRLDVAAAVRGGARLLSGSGYARAEVHVLTDAQRTALADGPPLGGLDPMPAPGGRPAAPGAMADSALVGLHVLVYRPQGEPPPNRGVARARPQPRVWLPGAGAVAVEVGGTPPGAGSAALQLTMGGRGGGRALAAVGGQAVLSAPRLEPGWRTGVVALEADELRGDDERPVGARVLPPAAVRAVSREEVGPFLVEALGVLADGGQVAAAGGAAWAESVGIGTMPGPGRTIVVPPADPARLGATNRALAAAGVPWRFGARVTRDDSLVAPDVPELSGGRVAVRHRLEPAGDGSGEVLARAAGEAWMVRVGRVVLVASRLVPEETALPLSGAFVPFVAALVNRVAWGESGVLDAYPGASVALPERVTALARDDRATALEPGAVVAAPGAPGVYAMLSGRDTVGLLVVGADARESDLTRAEAADWRRALPGARVSVTDDAERYAAERFRGAGRSELTGWLLAAALLVLLLESLLAAGRVRPG